GLVGRSGLFHLDLGARVGEALDAAGGPLEGADLLSLNLARKLEDGDQVLVGVEPADGGPPRLGSATISGSGTAASGGGDTGAASGGGGSDSGSVDLNSATAEELESLPGVGPVTSGAILDWREQNGRFTSVDQLTEVKGIGPATLADLREAVTV
ncbi:MAG: helix-hairpin-helix domain-containing protein, partial [Tomitella sp.]|nr:helix-hairpin-helix domain-containing protein [Tomitella sp.]